ncbi:hypothetical protein CK203_014575 [Vitis vinifera]|uniref:Retrotransposon gag domain-containing protein n=1 Tax=Vitis vinifera TaxID=29760 RepID=A0A438K4R7_VITVI|nr:hypothetical protein CK203_014575 [Vitis vinifera]
MGWNVRIPTNISRNLKTFVILSEKRSFNRLDELKLFSFTLKDKAKDQRLEKTNLKLLTKENKKFYECWERYMEAINVCPHHGFDTWLLRMGRMDSQPNASNAKAGMYILNEDIDMKAKFAVMARRLEELEVTKIREVQTILDTPVQAKSCSICQSFEHLVEECPMMQLNHQNFSWKPRATQYMQPGQAPSLEQAIMNLSKCKRKKIYFSTSSKPKGIHEVEAHEGESSQMREVKAVITLRSGKEVDLPISKPEQEQRMKQKREE